MIKWLKKRKSRSKKNFDLHKRGVAAFFIRIFPGSLEFICRGYIIESKGREL